MYDVRIFFSKTGRARYISHLDLNRCMQRALKRSGLPVVYTQGFNPHIRNTFALPLSLGYEGETETMDFRLEPELPLEEVARRLRESLPAEPLRNRGQGRAAGGPPGGRKPAGPAGPAGAPGGENHQKRRHQAD